MTRSRRISRVWEHCIWFSLLSLTFPPALYDFVAGVIEALFWEGVFASITWWFLLCALDCDGDGWAGWRPFCPCLSVLGSLTALDMTAVSLLVPEWLVRCKARASPLPVLGDSVFSQLYYVRQTMRGKKPPTRATHTLEPAFQLGRWDALTLSKSPAGGW